MTKYLFFSPFLDSQSNIKSRVASPVVTFPAIIVYLGHLGTASIILDVRTSAYSIICLFSEHASNIT
jgi:hypothetical protein